MISEIGIGVIYLPGLEDLIESFSAKIDVVEIEPQTTWYKNNLEDDSFRFDEPITQWLQNISKPKIFHGVGFPIGGTVKAEQQHFDTMNEQIALLKPGYISEHLSFNKYIDVTGSLTQTNFLLPVIQNKNGIDTAVNNINHYKSNIPLPFAFETGVNYLKPLKEELPDGFFFREVAEKSDSYILLDIHNLLANEINGRQRINELIKMLPLERVIEIHLAGGNYYNNYYLDGHSNVSSEDLLKITDNIVRQLPNLKAIIFEMIPEYYERSITKSALHKQFDRMKRIWENRGKKIKSKTKKAPYQFEQDDSISSLEWEYTVGNLVNSCSLKKNSLVTTINNDDGLQIIRDLLFEFRSSAIVSALKLTCRYIRLMTDSTYLKQLLEEYCSNNAAEIFGFANGERFSEFIKRKKLTIKFIDEIVNFEIAAMRSNIDGQKRVVNLSFEPFQLIDALVNNVRPEWHHQNDVVYQTELTTNNFFETNTAEMMKVDSVYHS